MKSRYSHENKMLKDTELPIKHVNQMRIASHSSVSPANMGTISPNGKDRDSGTFHGAFLSLIFELFLGRP